MYVLSNRESDRYEMENVSQYCLWLISNWQSSGILVSGVRFKQYVSVMNAVPLKRYVVCVCACVCVKTHTRYLCFSNYNGKDKTDMAKFTNMKKQNTDDIMKKEKDHKWGKSTNKGGFNIRVLSERDSLNQPSTDQQWRCKAGSIILCLPNGT